MEPNDIIEKLQNLIKQLKLINTTSLGLSEERTPEIEQKELVLIKKIVGCFNEILTDNFNIGEQNSPESSNKKNHYWTFISKHFNSPLVRFCIRYDENELGKSRQEENYLQKGEIWIFLSILEKSFSESIKEIYMGSLDEMYYDKNSLLRKYKSEIINILNELKTVNFNIKSKIYDKYLEFLPKNTFFFDKDYSDFNFNLTPESPIINNGTNPGQLMFSDISMIPILKNIGVDNTNYVLEHSYMESMSFNPIKEEKDFIYEKNNDFLLQIFNNFYTFVPNIENKNINNDEDKKIIEKKSSDENNNNKNNNISFGNFNSIDEKNSEDELNSSKFSGDGVKVNQELILNPKISSFLPTDKLYEVTEKKSANGVYSKKDKLIYKKKKRRISNSLLLYLNNFYKKTPYHKFYKHNLHNRPISLKDQNYQCYICLKKFSIFLDIPTEPIFWCSYYMRFICKNCIDDEYFIIPYFILEKWCFEKFPISKRAKAILLKWYDKPIIYFKKKDKILKVPQLSKVIEVKRAINNIVDRMKCDKINNFVKDTLGEYEYIALKEYLFSMRDLVEINKKTFLKKIKEFKAKFVEHISGECPPCKFDGEICTGCGFDEKIFFYDTDNVLYCKICKKSYHKRCIGVVGHVH